MSPEYKSKIREILLEKYGTDKFYQINRIGNSSKKKFKLVEDLESLMMYHENSESFYNNEIIEDKYILYRNEVRRLTRKSLESLMDNWDGLDYYDKEIIEVNYKLDKNDKKYPTIDHKISVYYGFVNNLPPEEISDISNLCITKRFINSKKRDLIESEFILD
jgi:hypothetical protein